MSDYDDIPKPDGVLFGRVLIWVLFLAVIAVIGFFAFNVPAMFLNRHALIYQTETDKQVYDTSRQYQQGTQLDLARYCAQYESATGSGKQGIAGLIRDTRATYTGPVTDNVAQCLVQVGAN